MWCVVCTEMESKAAPPPAATDFQRASSDGAHSAFGLKIPRGSYMAGAVRATCLLLSYPVLCVRYCCARTVLERKGLLCCCFEGCMHRGPEFVFLMLVAYFMIRAIFR